MSDPESSAAVSRNGVKTMAIRFRPDQHAQLSLIAQLREHSFQDEVIAAVETHVEAARSDQELHAKVAAAQAEIARRAQESQATLTSLFTGEQPPATPDDEQPIPIDQGRSGRSRSRRTSAEEDSTS